MSNRKGKPSVGDYIEHFCSLNGRFEGIITEILSTQFIYETPEGHSRFCLYKENWNDANLSNYTQKERD